ncbi:MAG: ABC transporter substrate-binding protein [Spirochaetales bacterium]|nr:ABC transporter substrate-binding protein [Spirochaetales bacterium]
MRRRVGTFLFTLLCSVVVTGFLAAGGQEEQATELSVVDAQGRTVTLPVMPERIVVAGRGAIPLVDAAYLFPEAKEHLFSMVLCDQGMGTFAAALDPDFIGENIFDETIGPEDVVAQRPDCVLMKSYMAETLGNPLEQLGIPVVYLDLESPEQFSRDVRILGKLFGNPGRAEEVLTWYEDETAALADALSGPSAGEDPRVLFLYRSAKGGTVSFNVPPAGWLQGQLVLKAGGEPVWTAEMVGQGWMKVGLEQIARWDPEVIFLTDYFNPLEEVKADLLSDLAWKEFRSVREGRLYAFPSDFYVWDQPDTRWLLALKWMASKLHPEVAPVFDPEAEVPDFFETLYGMDGDSIEGEVMSRLKGDF